MSHHFSAQNVQEDTKTSVPKPKLEKKKIIIIIAVVLFLCSCISAAGAAGVYIYIQNRDNDTGQDSSSDAQDSDGDDSNDQDDQGGDEDITDDGTDDAQNDENNDSDDIVDDGNTDDGNTSDDGTSDDNGGTTSSVQPEFTEVLNAMSDLESYALTATLVGEGEIYAEYQAPDKEYVKETTAEGVSEEIAIGDDIYVRENGGAWEVGTTDYLTGFSEDLLDEEYWTSDFTISKEGTKNGYWLYSASDDFGSFELLVHKDTNYIYKMDVEAGGESLGGFVFSKFDSSEIDIQKPI